jgi:hypothetical protein
MLFRGDFMGYRLDFYWRSRVRYAKGIRGISQMTSLTSDIVGRVKRLPLKPTATSALMPLFEAVSNSLHAIEDRFGDQATKKGQIEIVAHRKESGSTITGFTITDNGVGLTKENFESFLKPDSQYKLARGGKGIGRLGWLKVFRDIRVDSQFNDGQKKDRRVFKFVLTPQDQIVEDPKAKPLDRDLGTTITLSDFDTQYGQKCPSRWQTIVERIIGHFLPVFAAEAAPFISYEDDKEYLDLRDYFKEQIESESEQDVPIELNDEETITLKIKHLKAKKNIRAEKSKWNWLFLSANDRVVEESALDGTLGLTVLDKEYVYLGCASGEYLNNHVNQERNSFTFDSEENTTIRRELAKSARSFLSTYIDEALAGKQLTTTSVIAENPQFLYVQGEMTDFVKSLPPNATSKEEILVELSRHRFRRQREFRGIEKEIQASPVYNQAISDKVEEYKKYVQAEQMGSLAEYVLKRKSVLDLLDKFLGYDDADAGRHHLEEAVHNLICPMKTDSASLQIGDHNLWIADDRLAFFSFFASDKQFKTFTSVKSGDRPDLAFFYNTCFAWRESANPNTIVLVEFKRPGREAYPADDDPMRQVLSYVQQFKTSTSMKDSRGNVLNPNISNAAFHCYIVADLTNGLRERLLGHGMPTPDGAGLFGYTQNPAVYFEIIPYSKLIRDAKARNAIFFERLGLNDFGQIAAE